MSKNKQILALMAEAAQRHHAQAQLLRGAENPQVVEIRKKAETTAEILDAVIQAFRGDPLLLKLLAG